MAAAKRGEGEPIKNFKLKDPRYPPSKWEKMEYTHRGKDEKVRIHYIRNRETGEMVDFKFKPTKAK